MEKDFYLKKSMISRFSLTVHALSSSHEVIGSKMAFSNCIIMSTCLVINQLGTK